MAKEKSRSVHFAGFAKDTRPRWFGAERRASRRRINESIQTLVGQSLKGSIRREVGPLNHVAVRPTLEAEQMGKEGGTTTRPAVEEASNRRGRGGCFVVNRARRTEVCGDTFFAHRF